MKPKASSKQKPSLNASKNAINDDVLISVLENLPICAIILNASKIRYVNKETINMFQLSNQFLSNLNTYSVFDFILPPYHIKIKNEYDRIIKGQKSKQIDVKIKTYEKNIFHLKIKSTLINFQGEKAVQVIFTDITEESIYKNKLAEEKGRAEATEKTNKTLLKEIAQRKAIEAKLNAVFNTSTHIIWTIDNNYNFTSFNKNYSYQLKYYYNYNLKLGENFKKLYNSIIDYSTYNFWITNYKRAFNGENVRFETEKKLNNNHTIYREVYFNPVFNDERKVIEVVCISHNITQRKLSELKAHEQAAKLNAIFESGTQLIWSINTAKQLIGFNQNYANFKYKSLGIVPKLGEKVINQKDKFLNENYNLALNGTQNNFIQEITDRFKNKLTRQVFLHPIKDSKGNVIEVSAISFDITENKKNEERLTTSLKEKEILLREVHHRVKNNMQVISSILNLQSSYITDPYAINVLKESQNRIKTMAFVHESLYQNKNFQFINFSEYVGTLSKNLVSSYSVNAHKIKLLLTLCPLELNINTSIPCGLIINEIISNSLKYAFPDNTGGVIFVNLTVIKNQVCIELGDNGIGIPKKIKPNNVNTLGLQLVSTLVEQINGSLTIDRRKGSKFIIKFKNQV